MNEIKNLYPIGTVVRLAGATKRLMIFGVKQTDTENDKDYDYIGVLYPEGNLGGNSHVLFNHADVEEVFHRGFEDAEREDFIGKLAAFYETNNT